VYGAQECDDLVYPKLIHITHQVFTQKASDTMTQGGVAASHVRVGVNDKQFLVVDFNGMIAPSWLQRWPFSMRRL
jgi:hypothetical protein